MDTPVFLEASQILARLLAVDGSGSGLDADTVDGQHAAAFAAAAHTHSYQPLDAELTAIAGLTSAANTVPSFTGSGTAALLTVGTGANNLVQLTAASKLPAVDGSLLTNLPAPSGVLLATGATTGATSQAQTFTNSIIATAGMKPAADTSAYKWLTKADGTTAIVTANTVGSRISVAGSISVGATGRGLTVSDGDTNHSIVFISGGIEFTAFSNSLFRFKDAVTAKVIEIRPASELISLPTIEITTGSVRGKEVGGAAGGDITVRGGHSTTATVFSGGNGGNLILSTGQHTDDSAGHQGTVGDIVFKGYTAGATATLQEIGRWKGDTGLLNVVGTVQADGLRIDVTPTAETPSMTHTITFSANGTNYKIPCVAA